MRTLLLVAATLAAGLAFAQAPGPSPLKLVLGKTVVLDFISQQTLCDDPSLVSVAPAPGNTTSQITGLKVGKTQCSLGAFVGKGVRRLYDVEVVPPPAK